MNRKLIVAVAVLVCSALAVNAQGKITAHVDSLRKSHQVVQFGSGPEMNRDSVQRLIDMFYYDQFKNSQDPDAPYFLFLSKDSKMAMGVGGQITASGWYGWGNYTPSGKFIPADIPMVEDPANNKALGGDISGTRLYFRLLGVNKRLGSYQAYIEAKFNGASSRLAFKLNKAYVTLQDWTVGYATSTFVDPVAQPFTIDPQGVNSELSSTNILVRWMHPFKKNWRVAASLEMPNADTPSATVAYKPSKGYVPNVAAFLQYEWAKGEHVRLSGIMRMLPYRNMMTQKNHSVVGWGIQASSVWAPAEGPVTLFLNAKYGQGIAGLTNDLSGEGLDLLGNPDDAGTMYAPAAFGYFGGVQYNFSHAVFASATFGELRFLPGHEVSPDTYRYGLYGAANICWHILPRVTVGAEFNIGKHKEFSGDSAWGHRAGIMAKFSF